MRAALAALHRLSITVCRLLRLAWQVVTGRHVLLCLPPLGQLSACVWVLSPLAAQVLVHAFGADVAVACVHGDGQRRHPAHGTFHVAASISSVCDARCCRRGYSHSCAALRLGICRTSIIIIISGASSGRPYYLHP